VKLFVLWLCEFLARISEIIVVKLLIVANISHLVWKIWDCLHRFSAQLVTIYAERNWDGFCLSNLKLSSSLLLEKIRSSLTAFYDAENCSFNSMFQLMLADVAKILIIFNYTIVLIIPLFSLSFLARMYCQGIV
jgi:hypothetical protein